MCIYVHCTHREQHNLRALECGDDPISILHIIMYLPMSLYGVFAVKEMIREFYLI